MKRAEFKLIKTPHEFTPFKEEPSLVLVFVGEGVSPDALVKKIKEAHPEAKICGCSAESMLTSRLPFVFEEGALLIGLTLNPKHFKLIEINFEEKEDLKEKLYYLKETYPEFACILLGAFPLVDKYVLSFDQVVSELRGAVGGIASKKGDFHSDPFYIFEGEVKQRGAVVILLDRRFYELKCFCFHGWLPVKKEFKITKAEALKIFEIEEIPAFRVVQKYSKDYLPYLSNFLCPFLMVERRRGNFIPAVCIKSIQEEFEGLETYLPVGEEKFYFSVPDPLMLKHLLEELRGFLKREEIEKKNVKCVFVFSCVGRKMFLEDVMLIECTHLARAGLEYAGFFTWGEVGHFERENQSLLHNLTLTIGILCER